MDEIEALAVDERLLDRDVLDHPPDFALVVKGEPDPQALARIFSSHLALWSPASFISSDQSSRQTQ